MEIYKVERDITLFCVKASSFPDGIKAAHDKLSSIATPEDQRNYFGISYLYDDEILYMAGAEIKGTDEDWPPGYENYILKKGDYVSIYIPGFAKDISLIDKAFKKLLDDPRIDENGCCAECYLPQGSNFSTATDMRCMVRLADLI